MKTVTWLLRANRQQRSGNATMITYPLILPTSFKHFLSNNAICSSSFLFFGLGVVCLLANSKTQSSPNGQTFDSTEGIEQNSMAQPGSIPQKVFSKVFQAAAGILAEMCTLRKGIFWSRRNQTEDFENINFFWTKSGYSF